MTYQKWSYLILLVLVFACSSDQTTDQEETGTTPISFTAVAQDGASVFQIDYEEASDEVTMTDLTAELGIGTNFLTLRQLDNRLAFYSFSLGAFSLRQRDINTGENFVFEDFYRGTGVRSILWGANSEESIFLGFFSPPTSRNYFVRVFDLPSLEGVDIPLAVDTQNVFQPRFRNGRIFMPIVDGNGMNQLLVFDEAIGSVVETLNFGFESIGIFFDEMDNLVVIRNPEGNQSQLEVYDFTSLQQITNFNLVLEQSFRAGSLFDLDFVDGNLYYPYSFSQPSPLVNGPATYNVTAETNAVVDLISIVNSLDIGILDLTVSITTQAYQPEGDLFLVGYEVDNLNTDIAGGILLISADGILIDNITLPVVPFFFVRD